GRGGAGADGGVRGGRVQGGAAEPDRLAGDRGGDGVGAAVRRSGARAAAAGQAGVTRRRAGGQSAGYQPEAPARGCRVPALALRAGIPVWAGGCVRSLFANETRSEPAAQTKSLPRAASVMAMTAGCLSFFSREMAVKRSRVASSR